MPIPNDEELKELVKDARKRIKVPKDWKLTIDVRPYCSFDIMYEIHKKKKLIELTVYSANYPHTYTKWIDDLALEIRGKMKW